MVPGYETAAEVGVATNDGPMSVPLRSRRIERARRMVPLRDGVAALVLAWAALPRFRSGVPGEVALAVADAIVAAALVGAIVYYNFRPYSHHHARVEWTDLAAGAMLLVEAFHQHREGRPGRALPYATIVTAFVTLGKGLLHERFAARDARRRVLRLDHEGLHFRWSRLFRSEVKRRDVAALAVSDHEIVVTAPDGARRRISLRHVLEPAMIAAAVRAWAAREGIAMEDGAR